MPIAKVKFNLLSSLSKRANLTRPQLADFGVAQEEPKWPKKVLKKIARLQRPGGALYVSIS